MNILKYLLNTSPLRPATWDNGAPKARNEYEDQRGKTRKGATHKVGHVFKSRRLWGMSPAEWRRRHMSLKENQR